VRKIIETCTAKSVIHGVIVAKTHTAPLDERTHVEDRLHLSTVCSSQTQAESLSQHGWQPIDRDLDIEHAKRSIVFGTPCLRVERCPLRAAERAACAHCGGPKNGSADTYSDNGWDTVCAEANSV
jgi:hypothetical protein